MATQRITIAKVGGLAADAVVRRLREWSVARPTASPDAWSSDQWPLAVRNQVDDFADRLRAQAAVPPVVHFVEWVDTWSSGDLFHRWLTPAGESQLLVVYANRFEVRGYELPDGGRLAAHLASAGPQQFEEADRFVWHLWQAVEAWQNLVDRAVLVVLRQVVGATVTDEELKASLSRVPDWLSE